MLKKTVPAIHTNLLGVKGSWVRILPLRPSFFLKIKFIYFLRIIEDQYSLQILRMILILIFVLSLNRLVKSGWRSQKEKPEKSCGNFHITFNVPSLGHASRWPKPARLGVNLASLQMIQLSWMPRCTALLFVRQASRVSYRHMSAIFSTTSSKVWSAKRLQPTLRLRS